MKQHFDVPMAWTTDVNAAAYGEYVAGNGQHTSSCVYYTIELVLALERFKTVSLLKALAIQKWGMR